MTQPESDAQDVPEAPASKSDQPLTSPPGTAPQPRNPLHGVTLEHMVTTLADTYGWPGLAERIPVRCFSHDPSVASSLKFLRKTPWAREKVEALYLFMLREKRRNESGQVQQASRYTP